MIRAENLGKRFGDRAAVEALDLEVAPGEVFGLLGPNGAGKTTTVRMLTSLIAPTAGRAWVNGHAIGADDAAVRRSVGVLTEVPGLYARLTAAENLRFFGRLHSLDDLDARIRRFLTLLGLWERRDDRAGSFSKGMRQKLAIARTLLHDPPVVFLDEPTAALDPSAARVVRDFIAGLRDAGRAIVLCTHNLDEAQRLCNRIAIMQRTILKVGTAETLRAELAGDQLVVTIREVTPAARAAVVGGVGDAALTEVDGRFAIATAAPDALAPGLVRALVAAGADVLRVEVERPSLEAVYLDLVGEAAPADAEDAL
ncbi:MAG: multidrug ABC transporter ATP-binding protein [Deltaproteobacteria bacterium HGW-Deltaproteobacteria-14]|nr:MAG: multidrug ABC transporter ATP-binding protein [Deltaproteobacteria bacterium HGW-Deltaproteobacteria-14]